MLVLVSPADVQEAIESIEGGADIIDVKNPAEGSLGANYPWVIRDIAKVVKEHGKEVSATIGDMDFKPGTASLAAFAVASCGANYVKVGLYGVRRKDEAFKLVRAVVNAVNEFGSKVVVAGYADFRRIGSISPLELPEVVRNAGAHGVMVDTAVKDGSRLFDHMGVEELATFVELAHSNDLFCALAGSIQFEDIPVLKKLGADIVGVRTAVCENGRNSKIRRELVAKLVEVARS
ncbi:(5-formylfuran-3-yl)methyl phosphate synthase [Archaeoglobus veneficus]|uniref:(5-formylfuran-3-yl)methyl phosphate synthase n=1 Tax=Archaeoglobus veneficus (strain DSM 11195 / SNP6) TaxID=693661 RepID=F2KQ15_ARCVS|nr:(5-formylfuran-3-yl)methyl phosphate synthase [Archaeoglobus veneficus]AEA47618.1 UPF0264 protein [Archaeoglobus veneficus SNP6]